MLVIALACLSANAAENVKHDGIWWNEKSGIFKEAFVVGYEEGSTHSRSQSKHADWGIERSHQLVDGLNAFYGDFRNLKIHVDNAIDYVNSQLNGKTDDDLAPELQRLRKNAADNGDK